MKQTIVLIVSHREETPFEVEFPSYSKTDFSDSTFYRRINSDLSSDEIDLQEGGVNLEHTPKYNFDASDPDYHLGRGEHECTEDEFLKALAKADALLAGIHKRTMKND